MPWWAVFFAIWANFPAVSVTLETPDPRIAQRLTWAQVDVQQNLVCQTISECDDVAVKLLALTGLGQLEPVRTALAPMPSRTPLWILAHYNYWLASADHEFLQEHWPALATSLFAPPAHRIISDASLDLAAIEAILAMARAVNDTFTTGRVRAVYALADQRAQEANGVFGAAFGVINADRAEARVKFIADTVHEQLPLATGLVALALYEQHQGIPAFRMLQRMAAQNESTSAMYVLPLMKGLLGWEVDAPNRAVGFEPHLPAAWQSMNVTGLVAGADTIDVLVRRDRNTYSIQLRRRRSGLPISVQLAPALPHGARVRHIKVNDEDAAVHLDTTPYDTHVIVEFALRREAVVEIEYEPRRRSSR